MKNHEAVPTENGLLKVKLEGQDQSQGAGAVKDKNV